MGKMNVPSEKTLYSTHYDDLKGVDFTSDPVQVNKRRSPDAINVYKDNGAILKRKGWHKKYQTDGKILKLFTFHGRIIAITTTQLIILNKADFNNIDNSQITTVPGGIQSADTIEVQGKVFIVINHKILGVCSYENFLFTGWSVFISEMTNRTIQSDETYDALNLIGSQPYIPETLISMNPNGSGGVFHESINLLTPYRVVSFLGDAQSTIYSLAPNDASGTQYICRDGIAVYKMANNTGHFYKLTEGNDYTLDTVSPMSGYNEDGEIVSTSVTYTYITFNTPPGVSPITGQDNVKVVFKPFSTAFISTPNGQGVTYAGTRNETKEFLLNSKYYAAFGSASDDRVFMANGNKAYYSAINNVNYFPDDNYIIVGNSGEIRGLTRMGTYLAVIKEKTDYDNTVFLVESGTYDGKTVFITKSTLGNVGIIGDTLSTLNDEPMFLSKTGIYAITNSYVNTEKNLRNRSRYLDGKLLKETNLENSYAISLNGYYMLFVNDKVYLLDSRQTATDLVDNTNYNYEGYLWDNFPATCVCDFDNTLYFGGLNGEIYRLSDDLDGEFAYCDNPTITDGIFSGGTPIKAKWTTCLDDDNYPQNFKNLNKKGTLVTMKPYDKTSVKVSLSKDGEFPVEIGKANLNIFNWSLIDFENFTFDSNDKARDLYTNKKMRKYKRLQFIFENEELYEPFGIIGITKTYSRGNLAK